MKLPRLLRIIYKIFPTEIQSLSNGRKMILINFYKRCESELRLLNGILQ